MTEENRHTLLTLLARHKTLGIADQIDFEKFYLYSLITHSTAIEGSTVTEVEAQLLFDEGITSNKRTIVEQNMNLDLKAAYDYGRQWISQNLTDDIDQYLSTTAAEMVDKSDMRTEMARKWSIKPSLADKLADILVYAADKEEIRTEEVVDRFGFPETSAKRYLRQLTAFGYMEAHGGNRNKTYSKKR